MFVLPESITKIGMKTTKKSCKHHSPHYKSMGVFLDIQVQITPYYVVLHLYLVEIRTPPRYDACPRYLQFKMDWIITKREKWKHQFFRRLRAANFVVRGRVWPNFKLTKVLMYIIITKKYEKHPIKNNREKVATPFSNYNTICFHGKPVVGSGRISNSSKLLCMSCKYEKNKMTRGPIVL